MVSASMWQRFGVVLIDNSLSVVAFLPGFLTGVATGFGATGWPSWMSPTLIILGVAMGVGALVANGGVLAGRGRSVGMMICDVCLVDVTGHHPVGTGRAVNRALLSLFTRRVGDEQTFAELSTRTVLMSGHPNDLRPRR